MAFDGALAGGRRYRGDLLVPVVGAARPDHVDAADVVPRRTGAARRPSGVPRRTAWGSTSADADRKLLPTHASDDLDEALQQAELLKQSAYGIYDEVALKGLQLAANDAQRGVLGAERLERIKRSVRSLVNDLGWRDDGDPHPVEKEEAQGVASKVERDIPAPAAECRCARR